MLRLFLFIALLISSTSLEAQLLKPIFKEDQFSGEFYGTSRDRLGYIWISTDQGVYRWDSKYLEHFTTADGLPSNEVFRCYMDSKERVWMTFYNGDICYYYQGIIFNKANDTNLRKLGKVYHGAIIEHKNNLYLSNLNGDFNNINFKHKKIILKDKDTIRYYENKFVSNYGLIDDEVYVAVFNRFYSLPLEREIEFKYYSQDSTINLLSLDSTYYITTAKEKELQLLQNNSWNKVEFNFKNKYLIGLNSDKYYYLDHRKIYSNLNGQREFIFADSLMEFSASNYSNPSFLFNNTSPQAYHTHLDKLEIIKRLKINSDYSALFNHKNQTWVYAQNQGITNLITGQDISIPENEGKFYNLALNESKIAVVHAGDFFVPNLKTGNLLNSDQNYLNYGLSQKKMFNSLAIGLKHGFWLHQTLYLSSYHGLFQLTVSHQLKQIYSQRVNSAYLDQQGRFWLSKPEGIYYTYQYEPKIEKLQKLKIKTSVSVQAIDYREDTYGNLLMATNDGIYIVSKANQVAKLQMKEGLTSNDCKKIYLDSDGSLWVATNLGVNHLKYWKNGKFRPKRINYFLKTDGLQSNNIRDLAIQGDSLYIISDKGLDLVVNKHWRQAPSKIPLHINRLYVTGQKLDSTNFPTLNYNQNSLQIDFSAIYYDRTDRLKIYYRLIADGDTTVQEIKDRTILLQSLAPNDYRLQIYAYDQDYPDSIRSVYKELRIHILPPFYKTWWFFTLLFLTLNTILGWTAYLQFKRKKDQLENENLRLNLEKNLSKFKLEALKAEMNPHFIFNCLNSIKNFILQSDIEKSQYYLSQLSKLIRIALYNTKEEFISLRSELEFIDLYVELEQLRYDHQFDFEKYIANEDLLNAEIPTMVLQPFFENAVRHGKIGQLENKRGKLKLNIQEEDGFIVFRILDNGIGIEEAHKIKTESNVSYKSMALDIIKERIAIYNQSYDLDMQLQIEPSSEPGYTTAVEIRYILD